MFFLKIYLKPTNRIAKGFGILNGIANVVSKIYCRCCRYHFTLFNLNPTEIEKPRVNERSCYGLFGVAFVASKIQLSPNTKKKNILMVDGMFVPHEITLCFFMDEGPIWILKALWSKWMCSTVCCSVVGIGFSADVAMTAYQIAKRI